MEPFSSLSMRRFELLLDEVKADYLSQPGMIPIIHSAGMAAVFDLRGDIEWAFALNVDPNEEPRLIERRFVSGFVDEYGEPTEIWIRRTWIPETETQHDCERMHSEWQEEYTAYRNDAKAARDAAMAALGDFADESDWDLIEPFRQAMEKLFAAIREELEYRERLEFWEYQLAQVMDLDDFDLNSISWVTIQFADAEEEESHP